MTGEADYREVDRWENGVGWIAYPEETMQRASHILKTDGGSWIIDPVDADGLDELIGDAEVKGVVVLLDRHKRDAAAVANRYGVSVHLPSFMGGVASELDAPTETFDGELGDTEYGLYEVINNRFWQEAALYSEEDGTLYLPEAVGTVEYFRTSGEKIGVHPMLRLKPPAVLSRFRPDRIMVGHGEGVSEDATESLRKAVKSSRREAPALYLGTLKSMIFG
jgi:hypothetical protein